MTYRRTNCCFYADLGVLRFFMDHSGNLNDAFLQETHQKYIQPIKNYDAKNETQLFNTLSAYINNDCSKVNTEKQLFIHKNTLRARLAAIERITGIDLSRSECMFYLQLAFKIDYFYANSYSNTK